MAQASQYDLQILRITPEQEGQRIDKVLSEQIPTLTRSLAQRLCEEGDVLLGTKTLAKSYKVQQDQEITVRVPLPRDLEVQAQEIPIEIVYEDDQLLVVNKPKGMVVHPAPGNEDGTLVNALLWHCRGRLSSINGVIRPGIVHRIDKDTSGLLVVAKTDLAHLSLSEQIKAHTCDRQYEAVVYGHMPQSQGTVDLPLGRHPKDRKKMAVCTDGRQAVTHYEVLEEFPQFSHLRLQLETGRTHQIRVHMAHLGHPVAGDPVYGPKKVITKLQGQCLHARTLGFVHPSTGERMVFTSPLPAYFTAFLSELRGGAQGEKPYEQNL